MKFCSMFSRPQRHVLSGMIWQIKLLSNRFGFGFVIFSDVSEILEGTITRSSPCFTNVYLLE